MSARAAAAIVRRRLSSATLLESAMTLALGLFLGLFFHPTDTLHFATLVSVVGATSSRFLRAEFRNPIVFAAPLYGRELARAEAVVPCLRTLVFVVSLAAGGALRGEAPTPQTLAIVLLSGAVASLTALSGALREGWSEYLYLLLAISAGIVTALSSGVGGYGTVLVPLAVASIVGYVAIRAFAETLARYDPI